MAQTSTLEQSQAEAVCNPASMSNVGVPEVAKGADLRQFSMRDLDDIAHRINTRPRRVLDWATSAELFIPRVRTEYVP